MKSLKSFNNLSILYGILLGDGCLSKIKEKYHFISIVGHIIDDLSFFEQIIRPILESFTKKKILIRKRIKQRKIEILLSNKNLFNLLAQLEFPIGKKGINLKIPSIFRNNLKFIIQGYFGTDGSLVLTNNNGTSYPRIEFSSISKPLLNQVLMFLRNQGMRGNLYISHTYPNKNWNTLYRLQFNGKANLMLFRKKIGFINPKQEIKYQKWKNRVPEVRFEHTVSTSPG